MWSQDSQAVLLHRQPGRRSVSVGVWFAHGAAHDPDELAGATHLIEHLTLRRCGRRDRRALAELIDRLGGGVDAWTSAETMCISAETTIDALDEVLAILRDAVLEPTFDPEDVDLERQVALAELQLLADDPAEQVGEAVLQAAWGAHPLARPVIGTAASLAELTPELLRGHHRDCLLRPGKMALAVVGDVQMADLQPGLAELPIADRVQRPILAPPRWLARRSTLVRPATDQVHVRLALPALCAGDPDAPVLGVLNRVLGSGSSSRLFQKLREDEGLTYDIWSEPLLRSVAGLLEIGWACAPERFADSWRLVGEELARCAKDLEDEEVEIALQGMTRGLQIDAETAHGRAAMDVGELLERGRRFDLERVLGELGSITPTRVRRMAGRILRPERMASAICGPEGIAERVA